MNNVSCEWVEFGNLAIGVGTFVLAIVLGISNWRTSSMDRKVHIANKRQDWINELRIMVAEYLSIAQEMHVRRKVPDDLMRRLITIRNKLVLMLNPEEENTKLLIEILDSIYNELFTKGEINNKRFYALKTQSLNTAQKIFKSEWRKIKNLKG